MDSIKLDNRFARRAVKSATPLIKDLKSDIKYFTIISLIGISMLIICILILIDVIPMLNKTISTEYQNVYVKVRDCKLARIILFISTVSGYIILMSGIGIFSSVRSIRNELRETPLKLKHSFNL